jgi:sirohydrochlorin cobaltochelatase
MSEPRWGQVAATLWIASKTTIMTMNADERRALEILEDRITTLLPEEYQDSYEELQPVSMGSAGLKYDSDGQVAWNDMWATFCDLAMAGGPPHKGTLLEPASRADIDAQPDRYTTVVAEICRGIDMAADLPAEPSPSAGWVAVPCYSEAMAGWLLRAIVMENVAAWRDSNILHLPAGPGYRLEKEIKNVVTVIAKTSHYWLGHVPRVQQRAIANLFTEMAGESPLVEPARVSEVSNDSLRDASARMTVRVQDDVGLRHSSHRYVNWLGLECPTVRAAIWMMRGLVASNILSRREATALFVPINPASDPNGEIVAKSLGRVHGFAISRRLF